MKLLQQKILDEIEGLCLSMEDAKRKFASQIMDHIHVDARDLTSHDNYMARSIELVLRVQCKKY